MNGTQPVEEATLGISQECAAVGTGSLRQDVSDSLGEGIDTTGFLDILRGQAYYTAVGDEASKVPFNAHDASNLT